MTGSTKGIGKATARELLQLGAKVFIVARDEARVHEVLQEFNAEFPNQAFGIHADLSLAPERKRLVDEVQVYPSHHDVRRNRLRF